MEDTVSYFLHQKNLCEMLISCNMGRGCVPKKLSFKYDLPTPNCTTHSNCRECIQEWLSMKRK